MINAFTSVVLSALGLLNVLLFFLYYNSTRPERVSPNLITSPASVPRETTTTLCPLHVSERNRRIQENTRFQAKALMTVQVNGHIDDHSYSYIINPEYPFCIVPSREMLLVILVCTSLQNTEKRQAIRNTWGSQARHGSVVVRLAFLLGSTKNRTLQQNILAESAEFSDIIQEDFVDTYNTLTLKSVMLLKWVTNFCPQARFVLKVDDDTFINMQNLVKYLTVLRQRQHMLFGRLFQYAPANRNRSSKYYVSTTVFKHHFYPDYLSGTAYVMSIDVAQFLYYTALRTPLFHLEDVFVTGICAEKARIPRRHHNGFSFMPCNSTACNFRDAISQHPLIPEKMYKVWYDLTNTGMT